METSFETELESWLEEELHCEAQHKKVRAKNPSLFSCSYEVTSYFTACYLSRFGKPSLYVCENFTTEVMDFLYRNFDKKCYFCKRPVQECISITSI